MTTNWRRASDQVRPGLQILAGYGRIIAQLPRVLHRYPTATFARNTAGNLSIFTDSDLATCVGFADVLDGHIELFEETL